MAELKPCPFCGFSAEYHATSEGPGHSEGYVRCQRGCCEQTRSRHRVNAIRAWNHRKDLLGATRDKCVFVEDVLDLLERNRAYMTDVGYIHAKSAVLEALEIDHSE